MALFKPGQTTGGGGGTSTTASYITSSGVDGPYGMNSILSASYAVSASHANDAVITASAVANTITFTKGDGSQFDVIVAGGGGPSGTGLTLEINGNDLRLTSASGVLSTVTIYPASSSVSSSYASTASFVTSSAVRGPHGFNSILSSSYAVSASRSVSSSYAGTASYALNGGGDPGGPNLSIQFNSASVFSGSSCFVITTNGPAGSEFTYDNIIVSGGWFSVRDGANSIILSTEDQQLNVGGGDKSVDWSARILYGSNNTQSIDYFNRQLYYSSGENVALDWGTVADQVSISGSVLMPNLTNASQINAIVIDTGSGQLYYLPTSSFGGGSGTPGGANKSIQFNSNQTFSGSTNFTFDSASNSLTLTGSLNLTGSLLHVGTASHTGSVFHSGSKFLVGVFSQTGSLTITGSTTQIGNNSLYGNTVLSGSIIISGSITTPTTPTIKVYGDMETNGVIKFMPVVKNIDTSLSASYIYVSGSTNDLYFSQNGSGYNNVTRLRWLEGNLYTGLLHGGAITQVNSTTYQVASGSGIIANLNASLNNDPYPTIQFLQWGNLTKTIDALSASYDQQFIAISSSGQIHAQGTPYYDGQVDTYIPVGIVLHQNHSSINGVKTQPSVAYGWKQRANVFISAFGPLKLSGHDLAVSSSRGLTVGSGTSFADGANYPTDPNNPSYVTDPGTNVSKIFRYRQSGSDWVYDTNGGTGYTVIDPTQYSNAGTLTSVGAGNWSIQRVFWYPNSVTKAIVVYYGNAIYATLAEATANINIETFAEAPNTAANAIYLGAVIINGTGVFTSPSDYTLIPGGLFRGVGGGGGGGAGTSVTLQTNGTNNGSQTILNLKQGTNISLSDDGVGGVTISSTGGSGGITTNTATGSYGSFYSTQTQTISAVSTPHSMSFDQTDISNGVSISGSTNPYNTYIKTANAGIYNLQFSAQLARAVGSGTEDVYVWLRKNGSDLSWTNTDVTFAGGTNVRQVAAWNWFVNAAAGDHYQVMWSSTSTNIILEATTTPNPDVPSVILTANRIDQFLSNTGSFTGSFTGAFTGSLFGTASWATNALTASYVTGLGSYNYRQTFTNQSTWTVSHNLNTQYVLVQAYDSANQQIVPQTITLTDANTVTITFPSNETGYAIATVGGGLQLTTASYAVTASYITGSIHTSANPALSASYALSSSYAVTSSATTAFDGAWTSYTPSWTAASVNPSIGNGTLQGWYKVVGKTCFVRGNIAMGSTTTFGSGEWYVSMPFTASHADAILMTANLLDNGTAWYNATLNGARAGFNYKTAIQYQAVGGTADSITPTAPFTWASSDRFLWNGSYEIA